MPINASPGSRGITKGSEVFSFTNSVTLVRTMQSASPIEEDYGVSFSLGPSDARPMQQLPMRHDVLFQLK